MCDNIQSRFYRLYKHMKSILHNYPLDEDNKSCLYLANIYIYIYIYIYTCFYTLTNEQRELAWLTWVKEMLQTQWPTHSDRALSLL